MATLPKTIPFGAKPIAPPKTLPFKNSSAPSPHTDPQGFINSSVQQPTQNPQSNVGGFGFIHDLAEPLVHAGIRTGQALSELIKPGSSEKTTSVHVPLLGDYEVAPPTSIKKEIGSAIQLPALALDSPVAAGAALAGGSALEQGKGLGESALYAAGGAAGGKLLDVGIKAGADALDKVLTPSEKAATKATGQIAQGETSDIPSVKSALSVIDTKGVKTFQDLQTKLKDAIPKLAKQVDTALSKDKGLYTPADLLAKDKNKAGETIATDYVGRALSHLHELYSKIGDNVQASDIKNLLAKATDTGLTRKEVNDLSRTYGQEFGSKAFSKMGDPLTSVNAQAFENTRSGLKDVARAGLGGSKAQTIDKQLSDVFNAKRLVDKNVEAVNKLKQKIQGRGLMEKAGHLFTKTMDMLSGGSIRGAVSGLLPRGAGYKVMNAVDLEAALQKNLSTIEKALNANDDNELIKIIKDAAPTISKIGVKAIASSQN